MFENVDGRTDDGVTGILIAHLRAFGSGELKKINFIYSCLLCFNHTCYCVNMVSVTSASRYITPATRYHPCYQSRSWSDSTEFRGIGRGSSDWTPPPPPPLPGVYWLSRMYI